MGLAELRRAFGRLLVNARVAVSLVLAVAAALPAAGQSAEAAEPRLRWRLDTTTPFVWQGVSAVLELSTPAPLPLVGPALVEPVAALDLQSLADDHGILALEGTDRYVIPVARYRLTARIAGRTALPEAHVTVAGTARTAAAVGLVVRPVTDPIAASRAVGEMDRALQIRRLETDAAELTVQLTGSGSVPFVEHPPPLVRGGRVVDTAVEVDAAGARKRWRYRLRAEGSGVLEVVVPALPYLRLPGGETALIAAETVTLPPPEAAGVVAGGAPRDRPGRPRLRRGAAARSAALLPCRGAAPPGRRPPCRRRRGGCGARPARRPAPARLAADTGGARGDRVGDRSDRAPPRRGHGVAAEGAPDRRPAGSRRLRGGSASAGKEPARARGASRPRGWPRCCWPPGSPPSRLRAPRRSEAWP